MAAKHYDNKEFVQRYVEQGPSKFAPGFEAVHRMVAQLLAESAPRDGSVLVVGAGGGHELTRLAKASPEWRFCAVDPSEEMLKAARFRMASDGEEQRVEWVQGRIDDAPLRPFDAATCLLTLHFVADDGSKHSTLQAIKSRLRPNTPLVIVDLCIDPEADDFDQALKRYALFAQNSGALVDDVEQTISRIRQGQLKLVSPDREVVSFREAGYTNIELFYAGFSWRGWSMRA